MTDYESPVADKLPSRNLDLLRHALGRRIVRMTRYGDWRPEDVNERLADSPNIDPAEVFEDCLGPLVVEIDNGLVLGVASEESLASMLIWPERNPYGPEAPSTPPLAQDPDLHPIDAADPTYSRPIWATFVGQRIIGIEILLRDHRDVMYEGLPCEAAVVFQFESGAELLVSQELKDDSGNSEIILRDEIKADRVQHLSVLARLEL